MRYVILLLVFLALVAPVQAATVYIYGRGKTVDIAIPVNQYINVFTTGAGAANVYQQIGGPSNNMTTRYAIIASPNGAFSNGEVSFGPFTTATNVRIESVGPDPVLYSIGALGVPIPVEQLRPSVSARCQPAPATYTGTATMLATELMAGILTGTQSSGSTDTLTLPTGTLLDTATGLQVNEGFEWSFINLSTVGGSTYTFAAGSGNTIVGDAVLQIAGLTTGCASARFFSRKTAANTFITYRVQ